MDWYGKGDGYSNQKGVFYFCYIFLLELDFSKLQDLRGNLDFQIERVDNFFKRLRCKGKEKDKMVGSYG